MSWSWGLDLNALVSALSMPVPWQGARRLGRLAGPDDEALEPGEGREIPLGVLGGRLAESLPTGPDLAGWLATTSAGELEDGALPGIAASFRRLASWAQAGELATVAKIAARSAALDDKVGVEADGRPARICNDASGQVSLALTMSQFGASWWTDLAVTLTWRLAATGAALASGEIDMSRARLIAEMTNVLNEAKARMVEAQVLAGASDLTTGQLRAKLRHAVIAADPEGAERRREESERRARVMLYPDPEGTATLTGQCLPGVGAAAAMARITALASALKAAGAGGGIDLLRAHVLVGLLLGTLPDIPPAPDSPPDQPSGDDLGNSAVPGDSADDPGSAGDSGSAGEPGSASPWDGFPDPVDQDAPAEDLPPEPDLADEEELAWLASLPGPAWPAIPPALKPLSARALLATVAQRLAETGGPAWTRDLAQFGWPGLNWPGGSGLAGLAGAGTSADSSRPRPGLLDLTVSLASLTGCSSGPGLVSRLGPVTASQARQVAEAAAVHPGAQWRVIVVDESSHAIAVTRVSRPRARDGPALGSGPSLVGRVTLIIPASALNRPPPVHPSHVPLSASGGGRGAAAAGAQPTPLGNMLSQALQAAAKAAAEAQRASHADLAAGGCAHTQAAPGYRPTSRLRELILARDVTCRSPTCRNPAWQGDLDHTVPYDQGGRTCSCNLGGKCRTHHLLKHHPRWLVQQPEPGVFVWTTSAGRSYTVTPDTYAA